LQGLCSPFASLFASQQRLTLGAFADTTPPLSEDARRTELIKLADRVAIAEERATEARRDLQSGIGEAHAEGASVRVIPDVVGLSPARVQALLAESPDE